MDNDTDLNARAYQRSFLIRAFGKSKVINNRKQGKGNLAQYMFPPSLFLWGPSNSGKTFTLERCLKECGISIKININCLEIMCGRRVLLETILQQLLGSSDIEKCDNLSIFIHQISGVFHILENNGKRKRQVSAVFIIDQPELLLNGNEDILRLLCSLREYIGFNLCCVLVSKMPWRFFSHVSDCVPPTELHFPQYTSDEIFKIITSSPPDGANLEVYNFYVKMVLSVHYIASRDLKKLWKLIQLRYEDFALSKKLNSKDLVLTEAMLHGIWKKIHPTLKADFEKLTSFDIKCRGSSKMGKEPCPADLPICSIFLTIAAFLASVNPPTSDKRFFVKASLGGHKKTEASSTKGFQLFPHSRLLAIFLHISNSSHRSRIPVDSSMISSISTLCDIGYLTRYDTDDTLDESKYRCHVSQDFVKTLCEAVDFNLDHYLFSLL